MLRWTLEKEVARRAGDANALMERLLDKRPLGDLVDANGYLIDSEDEGPPRAARGPGESQRTFRTAGSMQGGESRQITAVCCTFNVSAAEQHQPPEVLDQSLRDAQVLCATVASRFGGHVVGNLGGQVLFYFGFPRASDTDARRSAIVALEIVHEIRRRTADGVDVPIEVRVGIHTGIVTVLGTDLRQASPIFGVTPAQAVQLALEAPANGILVSGASFRHLAMPPTG